MDRAHRHVLRGPVRHDLPLRVDHALAVQDDGPAGPVQNASRRVDGAMIGPFQILMMRAAFMGIPDES